MLHWTSDVEHWGLGSVWYNNSMNFLLYIYTFLSIVFIDSIWLFSTGSEYKKWLSHLFADKVSFIPVVLFYFLYSFGVVYFVTGPSIQNNYSNLKIFFIGAFLGLIAYSAYDLTNQATLRDWPVVVTVIDMAWGGVVTGLGAMVAVNLFRYFH